MTAKGLRPRVVLLSPFHGGSHRAWATGLERHCAADIAVLDLPDRNWRWRMQGAALTLARRIQPLLPADVIVATDMLDVAAFLGLAREAVGGTPVILYMHENQLTYPLPRGGAATASRVERQAQARIFGMVNARSMAAADQVVFNSAYHRRSFFQALEELFERLPERGECDALLRLEPECEVIPVGLDTDLLPEADLAPRPPLVLWNQRWEYDKDPPTMFRGLLAAAARGAEFEVALCGESPGGETDEFRAGREALGERVTHHGFLPRDRYIELLGRARVVVSTARHEFFGISVLEGACAGALPLVPDRLSYPEVIPAPFHDDCLYRSEQQFVDRLVELLAPVDSTRGPAQALAGELRARYGWSTTGRRYDRLFADAVARPPGGGAG